MAVNRVPDLLNAEHTFVTGESYRTWNGAIHSEQAEATRRRVNSSYNNAIVQLQQQRTTGDTPDAFLNYCRTSREVLGAREEELLHLKRSLARFSRFRDEQRGLTRLAHAIQEENDVVKHVVFFGDGAGRNMPGAASTPSKKLIRFLAQYCIVIIVPEAWTSQTCPSCRRRTEPVGYRNRKCTTPPDAEPTCEIPVDNTGERILKRDVVGGINIGLRGVCHLLRIELPFRPVDV